MQYLFHNGRSKLPLNIASLRRLDLALSQFQFVPVASMLYLLLFPHLFYTTIFVLAAARYSTISHPKANVPVTPMLTFSHLFATTLIQTHPIILHQPLCPSLSTLLYGTLISLLLSLQILSILPIILPLSNLPSLLSALTLL